MSGLRFKLSIVLLAGSAALAACSKTGSPPTGFGVNVTVDATRLSADELKSITTDKLTVVSDKAGDAPVTRVLPDLPKAIQGGTVHFHYTPGASVTKSNKLTFGLDVLNGSKIVASGATDPIQLAADAVDAKIVLMPGGSTSDGGPSDGSGNTDVNPGDIVNVGGKVNGLACVTDGECGTNFCTDGVCCNERCQDVCASCNSMAAKGTCTAFAADTDPEFECSANPDGGTTADAGTTTDAGTSATEAGSSEAGSSDASATDADQSDAPVINTPDGGFMTTPRACASTCNGMRACKYPDATKSCGKPFCNTSGEIASFVCDGNGSCAPTLSECKDYKCGGATATCGTTCTDTGDCLSTDFCDGTKHCTTKKGNGVACVTPDECGSGNCIAGATGGVCCNTACDSPLTCTMAGSVGQCKCAECTTGTCQVYYPDTDGDGFGDRTATYALHTAKAACAGSPPVGFVADNTDCDDGDSNVHPGQTAFFPTKSRAGAGTFDYDCDGTLTKQTPEYPGGTCKFCGAVGACSAYSLTCNTAGQASSWQCPQEFTFGIGKLDEPISTDAPLITPLPSLGGASASLGPIVPRAAPAAVPIGPIIPIGFQCCGCLANDRTGYLGAVNCGATANTYTCQTCLNQFTGPQPVVPTSKTQACR